MLPLFFSLNFQIKSVLKNIYFHLLSGLVHYNSSNNMLACNKHLLIEKFEDVMAL